MIAEIFNCSCWINCANPDIIHQLIDATLNKSFNVIGMLKHNFTPYGFTCIWLLSESHLAVHSFPEENKCYIELSSCNCSKSKEFWTAFRERCRIESINIVFDERND